MWTVGVEVGRTVVEVLVCVGKEEGALVLGLDDVGLKVSGEIGERGVFSQVVSSVCSFFESDRICCTLLSMTFSPRTPHSCVTESPTVRTGMSATVRCG